MLSTLLVILSIVGGALCGLLDAPALLAWLAGLRPGATDHEIAARLDAFCTLGRGR